MNNSAVIDEYSAAPGKKGSRLKPSPTPYTPAEAMGADLRNMSQDEINKRFDEIKANWEAQERLRFLFSGRVNQLYAGPRRFRYVDLFCGAGGSSTGLTMAGGQLMMALNHSERNIITHSTNFPGAEHMCVDINHYDMRNLPRGFEVLWASPICFPAGTTVLTRRGAVPIEDVQVGEEVLTHQGRWRRVTKLMRNVSDTVVVKGHGHNALETTAEHPFYARRLGRVWNNDVRDYRKTLGEREWVEAKNLDSHMWATPTSFGEGEPVPPVGGRGIEFSEAFWWMVGRWLGDGFVRIKEEPGKKNRRDLYVCCGDHEADELGAKLAAVAPATGVRAGNGQLRWRRTHPSTATVYEATHEGLVHWLTDHFGRHAHGKRLPAWALTMPEAWRRALLDGYISADGNVNPCNDGRTSMTRFSSVSRPLAIGVRLLAVSLGHGASLYAPGKRTSGTIEGRTVAMRPSWSAGWVGSPDPAHVQTVDDDLHRWSKVRSVEPARQAVEVFNLSVEEDESYIADGIVVHNCTEVSPAGGNSDDEQPGEEVPEELLRYGAVGKDVYQRTRATAYDVVRACEVHMPPIVIVENVVEFATRWKLFACWLLMMMTLGYEYQIVCANSAHVEGPDGETAPQSRDRLYIMFNRRDVAKPDVRIRPRSWCGNCAAEVQGVQTWKDQEGYETKSGKRFLVGKYGVRSGQYYFTCPNTGCAATVHPVTKAAASIINFHFLGGRIGDRKRPLVNNSRRRIGRGILEFGGMAIVNSNHDTDRAYSLGEPMTTRCVKIGEGLATSPDGPQPFLDANGGSWNTGPASIHAPFRTRTTRDWEGLCVPAGAFVDTARNHAVPASVYDPLTTIAAGGNHQAIVVPYNRTGVAKPTGLPFGTVTTKDRAALVTGWDGASMDDLIDNSHYRMIQWYEQLLAQAFPLDYLMTGNIGERTAGAGNAVSANVAGFFGMAAADALERTAANPGRGRRRAKAGA